MMRASFLFFILMGSAFTVKLFQDAPLLDRKLPSSASAVDDLLEILSSYRYTDKYDESPKLIAKRQMRSSWEREKKRYKPVMYDGYTLDINLDLFKTTRICKPSEYCKIQFQNHFECVCPRGTTCASKNYFFPAVCDKTNTLPYVWVQFAADTDKYRPHNV